MKNPVQSSEALRKQIWSYFVFISLHDYTISNLGFAKLLTWHIALILLLIFTMFLSHRFHVVKMSYLSANTILPEAHYLERLYVQTSNSGHNRNKCLTSNGRMYGEIVVTLNISQSLQWADFSCIKTDAPMLQLVQSSDVMFEPISDQQSLQCSGWLERSSARFKLSVTSKYTTDFS